MRYIGLIPGLILMLLAVLCFMRMAWEKQEKERLALEAMRKQEEAQEAKARQKRIAAAQKAAREAERKAKQAEKAAEQQRKQADRLEAARQRAEYAERELAARRAAKALERGDDIPAEPARQDDKVESEKRQNTATIPGVTGNNAFKGHVVSFTGKLPGMTRREAIQAVIDNGGSAYEKMPAGTTLLVVGDKPGMCKMDKADEWIGQVRKITAAQFFAMLEQPLTLEPEEFAAMFAARFAA